MLRRSCCLVNGKIGRLQFGSTITSISEKYLVYGLKVGRHSSRGLNLNPGPYFTYLMVSKNHSELSKC